MKAGSHPERVLAAGQGGPGDGSPQRGVVEQIETAL